MISAPQSFGIGLISWAICDLADVIAAPVFVNPIRASASDANVAIGQERELQVISKTVNCAARSNPTKYVSAKFLNEGIGPSWNGAALPMSEHRAIIDQCMPLYEALFAKRLRT